MAGGGEVEDGERRGARRRSISSLSRIALAKRCTKTGSKSPRNWSNGGNEEAGSIEAT